MFYVVFSPRGFSNELTVAVFSSRKEAADFREDVDNDVNTWTVGTDSASHQRKVREFKKDAADYRMDPLTYYQAKQSGNI